MVAVKDHRYEVEYCNLELRFERRIIHDFMRHLASEGFSLFWSEDEQQIELKIRSELGYVSLHFTRIGDRFKIVGDYLFSDDRLARFMEKLIEDSRGHAVVKRFTDQQIVIENILFGEVIRLVEIRGVEHKVIFQKKPLVTREEMLDAFKNKRAMDRIPVLKMEVDYELMVLNEAMQSKDKKRIRDSKQKLRALRQEMLWLEL